MAVNTGYYVNWPRSIKKPIQGQGTEVLLGEKRKEYVDLCKKVRRVVRGDREK